MDVKTLREITSEIHDECVVVHSQYSISFDYNNINPYRITLYDSGGVSVVKCYSYHTSDGFFARQFHGDRWI